MEELMSDDIKSQREGLTFDASGKKCPVCGEGCKVGTDKNGKESRIYCQSCGMVFWLGTVGKKDIFGKTITKNDAVILFKGQPIRNKVGDLLWFVNDAGMGYKRIQFAPRKEDKDF